MVKRKSKITHKVIEGTIMEKTDGPQDSELRPYKEGYGFYGKGRILGYALFEEFKGKKVRITIDVIE